MSETAPKPADAADIIGRFMAEMEEVFGLINRPRRHDGPDRAAGPAEPVHDPLPLGA